MNQPVKDYIMYIYDGKLYWSRFSMWRAGVTLHSTMKMIADGTIKHCRYGDIPAKIAFEAGSPWAYLYLQTGEYFHSAAELLKKYGKNRQWIYNHSDFFERPPKMSAEESAKKLKKYFH